MFRATKTINNDPKYILCPQRPQRYNFVDCSCAMSTGGGTLLIAQVGFPGRSRRRGCKIYFHADDTGDYLGHSIYAAVRFGMK